MCASTTDAGSADRPRSDRPSSDRLSSGPDWDAVPFDVGCARCGHDLRGLQAPVCPACGLAFDWSDALPLEALTCPTCGYHVFGLEQPRCPECGQWFDWRQVLDDYRRRQKPFFEYRWRRAPVRSLVRTWYMALNPRRFWRRVDLHDPPAVGALAGLMLASCVAVGLAGPILGGTGLWVDWWVDVVRGGGGRTPTIGDLFSSIADGFRYMHGFRAGAEAFIWLVGGFGALLVFRQSMRRCRVRTVHIVRVCAYSGGMIMPILPAVLFAMMMSETVFLVRVVPFEPFGSVGVVRLCHVVDSRGVSELPARTACVGRGHGVSIDRVSFHGRCLPVLVG